MKQSNDCYTSHTFSIVPVLYFLLCAADSLLQRVFLNVASCLFVVIVVVVVFLAGGVGYYSM